MYMYKRQFQQPDIKFEEILTSGQTNNNIYINSNNQTIRLEES